MCRCHWAVRLVCFALFDRFYFVFSPGTSAEVINGSGDKFLDTFRGADKTP